MEPIAYFLTHSFVLHLVLALVAGVLGLVAGWWWWGKFETQCNSMQTELQQQRERTQRLTRERDELNRTRDELQASVAAARSQADRSNEALAVLEQERQEWTTSRSQFQAEEWTQARSALQAKLTQMAAELSQADERTAAAQQEQAELQLSCANMRSNAEERTVELVRVKELVALLEERCVQYRREIEVLRKPAAELSDSGTPGEIRELF